MVEKTQYEPGTPSWVDLGSPDVAASAAFYGGLFGWEAPDLGPESGGYRMFTLRGRHVAGLGPLMGEGQPPAWSTYVSVGDADATVRKAEEAGGKTIMEPMDVLDVGRMAIVLDTVGSVISLWQPRAHAGADLVNEPGTLCWNELNTREVEAAKAFYSAVFGWEPDTKPYLDTTYTEWKLGGRGIGGMIGMTDQWPAEVPSHWMVYFAVADADATVAKATELGGTVSIPPTDIPQGRFAILGDPHGAHFAIIQLAS